MASVVGFELLETLNFKEGAQEEKLETNIKLNIRQRPKDQSDRDENDILEEEFLLEPAGSSEQLEAVSLQLHCCKAILETEIVNGTSIKLQTYVNSDSPATSISLALFKKVGIAATVQPQGKFCDAIEGTPKGFIRMKLTSPGVSSCATTAACVVEQWNKRYKH